MFPVLPLAGVLLLGAAAPARLSAETDGLVLQRRLFGQVYPEVERGNWVAVDRLSQDDRRRLEDYVLWPDLRAAYLRATLTTADHTEIEAYLERYGALPPGRELRYRYVLHLAGHGRLDEFRRIYEQFYQGRDEPRLDCLALQADINSGRTERIATRAISLWMVGHSQVDECDPVFRWLTSSGRLERSHFEQRFRLTIEAREFERARWLARSIDAQHIELAERWLLAQRSPESFIRDFSERADDGVFRNQLVYAIERLAFRNPEAARELWVDLQGRSEFLAAKLPQTDRHIALWAARGRLPSAYDWLAALPPAVRNEEVMGWRARLSLARQSWETLAEDIALMSEQERESDTWRYWQAIAAANTSGQESAAGLLAEIARERSYYGFLAADALGLDYALESADTAADEAAIARLDLLPDLVRARELFYAGLDSRARAEWDAAIEQLDTVDKAQAAILAHRWNWASRAIATAAQAGILDDLAIRYPLPYREVFRGLADDASISMTWAYGVARSESLFMPDVRSSAGAIGVMQLMPGTGRMVARNLRVPFNGATTLTDVEENIRLGTAYLSQLVQRYGGNQVPATAAYNAGPARVDRWLPEAGDVDARIWIETIPFSETRDYVRRVLAAETIFQWRMTGITRRLSDTLLRVGAVGPGPVAMNDADVSAGSVTGTRH